MTRRRALLPAALPVLLVTVSLLVAGCSGAAAGEARGGGPSGRCPVAPVPITVSVDVWTDTVARLAGACGEVRTVLAASALDPHEYEPTPGDAVALAGARLVVLNGAGYDTWASKVLATLDPRPAVVDAAVVAGAAEGDNPHLWYSPPVVHRFAAAVTAELTRLAPGAADYFAAAAADWREYLAPYDAAVSSLARAVGGSAYAATEPVFDLMAERLGLVDRTPPGWRDAAANDADPSPGDVVEFQRALADHVVGVLVVNGQTAGAAPQLVRDAAQPAGVPVLEVTETLPAGQTSFVAWQLAQLDRLGVLLGVRPGGSA